MALLLLETLSLLNVTNMAALSKSEVKETSASMNAMSWSFIRLQILENYVTLLWQQHSEMQYNTMDVPNEDSQSIRFPCILLSCIRSRTKYVSYMRLSAVSALAIPEVTKSRVVAKHSPIDRASYPRRPEYPDRLLITHWKMDYGLAVLKCGKSS